MSRSSRAPIRIAHFGLGNFHRAHQAWYTKHACDGAAWGIVAFTGRSATMADLLRAQDCRYTLIERSEHGDAAEVVENIVEAVSGDDVTRMREIFCLPDLAIVTSTVTERGYALGWDGAPLPGPLLDEVEVLRASFDSDGDLAEATPLTVIGRLLVGLDARRLSGGGGLAVVPCDNIPDNGAFLRRGVLTCALRIGADLHGWVEHNVSFVSTSVDRITPKLDPAQHEALSSLSPFDDRSPVVTEPFSDWVLCGDFPAGRPRWEDAGARFVDDIDPWERRKLWLLNGAHTILALSGLERGHETVAEAMADATVTGLVDAFWLEAGRHLPSVVDVDAYTTALQARFRNPRIEHRLAQIALDQDDKLRLRIVPVAEAELAAGRAAYACAEIIGARLVQRGATLASLDEYSAVLAADPEFSAAVEAALTIPKQSVASPAAIA